MGPLFELVQGSVRDRETVRHRIPHLDHLDEELGELVVTAWVSSWKSSSHDNIDDVPYTVMAPDYRLMDHVSEVTELGMRLAGYRAEVWGEPADLDVLIPTLALHDVDKPMLYDLRDGRCTYSGVGDEMPHGVLGGMLLNALGFRPEVVAIVSTHSHQAPFHSERDEAWLLHYADFFSCDHALRTAGATGVEPFYRRHH